MGKDAEGVERQLLELEENIADRLHRIYGGGSVRRPRKNKPEAAKVPKPQKGHGPRPQPELLVEEQVHVLDEADETCTSCGEELAPWRPKVSKSFVCGLTADQGACRRALLEVRRARVP
jgi:transposase